MTATESILLWIFFFLREMVYAFQKITSVFGEEKWSPKIGLKLGIPAPYQTILDKLVCLN